MEKMRLRTRYEAIKLELGQQLIDSERQTAALKTAAYDPAHIAARETYEDGIKANMGMIDKEIAKL